MHRILPDLPPFLAGLAAVLWIGAGYAAGHPLALLFTLLVLAFYLVGALVLYRYRQATLGLERALASLDATPASLDTWLAQLDPGLREPVRMRVERGPRPPPGPALLPDLVRVPV